MAKVLQLYKKQKFNIGCINIISIFIKDCYLYSFN